MSALLSHPSFALVVGALLVALLSGPARAIVAIVAPLGGLLLLGSAHDGVLWQATLAGSAVVPAVIDPLARMFALMFLLVAALAALFGNGQASRGELPAAMLYAAAAVATVLAGDLLSLFVCWELMAIGSTWVIACAPGQRAPAAAFRYLMVHLAGGMLLLAGIAGHYLDTGSLALSGFSLDRTSDLLILAGFLVNAAAWPLSAWVADAYPEATWSGAVFLCAFTTKAAVYALLRVFSGAELLVGAGLAMVVYGLAYALREDDMRRLLAYAIVNQVGLMVAAAGIGTDLAINGAAAHAFNHVLYGSLLFMAAGAVMFTTGLRRLSELGGLHRSMPHTTLYACVGVLAMAAVPFTSGFVAKGMIPQAAAEAHLFGVWVMLQAASGGALLIGLRFLWFVFFGRDSGLRPSDPPLDMRLAMASLAAALIAIGLAPDLLYRWLPLQAAFEPYTAWHLVAHLQLLAFAGLAFCMMARWLARERGPSRDVDWLYREAAPALLARLDGVAGRLVLAAQEVSGRFAIVMNVALRAMLGDEGWFGRTWTTRAIGLTMLLVLLVTLVAAYVG